MYDAFGNLLEVTGSPGRLIPPSSATNRLSGAGTTYDSAGNLTSWNGALYEYDAFDQLQHLRTAPRSAQRLLKTFNYGTSNRSGQFRLGTLANASK